MKLETTPRFDYPGTVCGLVCVALSLGLAGCGSGTTASSAVPVPAAPRAYFAPVVGDPRALTGPQTYTLDDTAKTFLQTTYQISTDQPGAQVMSSGVVTSAARGLLELGTTATYSLDRSAGRWIATLHNPPLTGGFAVELAGQAGAFAQLPGQTVVPLAAAVACPQNRQPQTYQFLTLPIYLSTPASTSSGYYTWDPTAQTAYGAVDVSGDGSKVSFNNVRQFTLSPAGGLGGAVNTAPSSIAGTCAQTYYGNTISIPANIVVTDPGQGTMIPPQEVVGIGPTGLLVEDNGAGVNTNEGLDLGAGTGAVGLPKPPAAVDTNALVGAQYLGFTYGAGTFAIPGTVVGQSSHPTSFGFSSVPASCTSVAPATSTMIYGGNFSQDDPSSSVDCDLAIDLGIQDPANNGLYPHATVWIGASYSANSSGVRYSFPAIVIAGQLDGKYAVFVLGVDTTQPWAIYLLQSN